MLDPNGAYHLSPDRTQVLNSENDVVAIARDADGKTVYSPAEIHAAGKICIRFEIKELKVCVEYNEALVCVGWDTVNVEYCVEWADS